jgi:hypothetical protein
MTPVPPLASDLVDWGQLLEVIEAGLIAGVGISIAFSLVIFGMVRAAEAQQQSRTGAMVGYGAIGIFAILVCLGAVVFGVSTMLTK